MGGISNCHRHKNPLSPLWSRRIVAEQPYDLDQIKRYVDAKVRMATLHKLAAEIAGEAPIQARTADHPDAAIASSSNAVFRELATFAKRDVVLVRQAQGTEDELASHLAVEACRLAASLSGDAAVARHTALRTAARVAQWTWHVYRMPQPPVPSLAGDELKARLAVGGRAACAARQGKTLGTLVSSAIRVRASGTRLTQVAVLADVEAAGGTLNEKTVRRHWPAVVAALAACEPAAPVPVMPVVEVQADSEVPW